MSCDKSLSLFHIYMLARALSIATRFLPPSRQEGGRGLRRMRIFAGCFSRTSACTELAESVCARAQHYFAANTLWGVGVGASCCSELRSAFEFASPLVAALFSSSIPGGWPSLEFSPCGFCRAPRVFDFRNSIEWQWRWSENSSN